MIALLKIMHKVEVSLRLRGSLEIIKRLRAFRVVMYVDDECCLKEQMK